MTDAPMNAPEGASETAGRDYRETLFLPRTDFPMRAGLPKAEPIHLQRWKQMDLFARLREAAAGRETFVLHDGPPYANGHLHLGHALNKILKDTVVRSRQMTGFDAPFVPGWDCHGLPIEWKVEEEFRAKGRKKADVPASEFRAACRAYAAKWITVQSEEFQRLGIAADWDGRYATMDFEAEAVIVQEFLRFAETGQIKRGSKPVMWSPVEQTALAEAELEYADHQSTTIWVKFPVVHAPASHPSVSGSSVVIYTTTPWTIPGNRALAYGPDLNYGVYRIDAMETITDPKTGEAITPWAQPGETLILADALAEDVRAQARIAAWTRLEDVDAAGLKDLVCAHPFRGMEEAGGYWDFDVPLLAGDHVTDEQGTGFVHTAPSHGQEDYEVWLASGRSNEDIPDMVDERGAYYADVPVFAGMEVVRTEGKKAGQDGPANKEVVAKLIAHGALLARGRLTHSYPHSWRSKAPLIQRNTAQWFIPLGDADDPTSLRAKALAAIDETSWHPPHARNRISAMVEDRPDWLISRQRAWGVPLTIFVNDKGEVLSDPAVNARIVEAVRAEGADAWYTRPAEAFLGPDHDPAQWTKVEDILDVWFDSGCTHAFTLEARGDLAWPADLYLEGSDQHRGWFQSSLLEGCATRGRAPYKAVLTHGFTLDEEGRKMAKSLGNTGAPQEVADQYGAEILRLWVATSDFEHDTRVGPTIFQANVDTYRKLRNTLRYLLGALDGFSEDERVEPHQMPGLERYVLHRLAVLDETVRKAYAEYRIKDAFAAIFAFCNLDLSAFYLDVRKDSLYCDRPDAIRRRAARTVMDLTLDRLLVWLAPVMVFTTEEAWLARQGRTAADGGEGSVHLAQFPPTPEGWRDAERAARFEHLMKVRRVVTGALEIERREKRIGSSLEAAPVVYIASDEARAALAAEADGEGITAEALLADLVITSGARLADAPPPGAFTLEDTPGVAVAPARADGIKCARSWKYFDPKTADPRYPHLSPRDADAVAWWDAQNA